MFQNCVFKVSVDTYKWMKAAGIRAVKTMAQTAVAVIGTAAVVSSVDWKLVVSSAIVAGVVSLLTSVAGIPEVEEEKDMAIKKAIKAIAKTLFANPKNYGGKRSLSSIKYIVIHYTANDGDTDEANAKYFHNNVVKASAHYFVDDDSYTKSVPLKNIAWSVGGKKYPNCGKTGGGKKYGLCTNANSINIELCDTVRDGKAGASAATIQNAVTLTKKLMKKYNIDKAHVIRHFDVTGKPCPAYWTDDKKWKKEFLDKL